MTLARRKVSVAALSVAAAILLACAGTATDGWSANELSSQTEQIASTAARPGQVVGRYLAGRYARTEGDVDAAARFLEDALKQDSASEDVLREAFVALLANGRVELAASIAPNILKQDARSSLGNVAVGLAAAKKGDFAAARTGFSKIARNRLNSLLVPLLSGWALAGQKQYDAALKELDALSSNRSFAAFQTYHKALVLDLAGRGPAAEEAYRAAMDPSRGENVRVIDAFANFLRRAGKREEAERLYRDALAHDPDHPLLLEGLARLGENSAQRMVADAGQGLAEVLFGIGSVLVQEGSLETAVIFSRLALYMRPEMPAARILVGGVLEANQQWEAAIAVYRDIDPATPYGWSARLRVAAALQRLERESDAVSVLNAMAEERPARTDAVVALGDLHRGKERWAEAIAQYDRAVARLPRLAEDDWTLLYFRGIAHERSKQWQQAEDDFLKALELKPEQPLVLNYLGYSWVEQGRRLDEARQMIEKAVSLRPRDGYIVDSLGWILYRMGDYDGAVRQLERAVELRSDDPVINDHLGDAYWQVGRKEEARFQWRRALSFKPEASLVPEIERKLREGLVPPTRGG